MWEEAEALEKGHTLQNDKIAKCAAREEEPEMGSWKLKRRQRLWMAISQSVRGNNIGLAGGGKVMRRKAMALQVSSLG
jgi:hypothetical protein